MYIHIYTSICKCIYIYTEYLLAHERGAVLARPACGAPLCACPNMCVCIHKYIYIYIYMYVCIHINVYMYTYTCI